LVTFAIKIRVQTPCILSNQIFALDREKLQKLAEPKQPIESFCCIALLNIVEKNHATIFTQSQRVIPPDGPTLSRPVSRLSLLVVVVVVDNLSWTKVNRNEGKTVDPGRHG